MSSDDRKILTCDVLVEGTNLSKCNNVPLSYRGLQWFSFEFFCAVSIAESSMCHIDYIKVQTSLPNYLFRFYLVLEDGDKIFIGTS